jgi:hypothetical protein
VIYTFTSDEEGNLEMKGGLKEESKFCFETETQIQTAKAQKIFPSERRPPLPAALWGMKGPASYFPFREYKERKFEDLKHPAEGEAASSKKSTHESSESVQKTLEGASTRTKLARNIAG